MTGAAYRAQQAFCAAAGKIGTTIFHPVRTCKRGESVTLITGILFIVCVLLFRRGVVEAIVAKVKPLRV